MQLIVSKSHQRKASFICVTFSNGQINLYKIQRLPTAGEYLIAMNKATKPSQNMA